MYSFMAFPEIHHLHGAAACNQVSYKSNQGSRRLHIPVLPIYVTGISKETVQVGDNLRCVDPGISYDSPEIDVRGNSCPLSGYVQNPITFPMMKTATYPRSHKNISSTSNNSCYQLSFDPDRILPNNQSGKLQCLYPASQGVLTQSAVESE